MQQSQKRLTANQLRMALMVIRGTPLNHVCRELDINYYTMKCNIARIRERLGILDNSAIPRALVEQGYLSANDLPEPTYRMPL